MADEGCNTCGGIVHGAVGIVRAVVGIGRVEPSLKETRLRICLGHPTGGPDAIPRCERNTWGVFCAECGCVIAAKAGDEREKCPLGKWPERIAGDVTQGAQALPEPIQDQAEGQQASPEPGSHENRISADPIGDPQK